MDLPNYFMKIAEIVKLRSGCKRRKVGAVFVVDDRLVATGYNQAPSGIGHCEDVGCVVYDGHCIRAIHAELNGILNATKAGQSLENSTVYVTTYPCLRCLMALRNAGVKNIWYSESYEYPIHEQTLKHMLTPYFNISQYV